MTPSSLTSSSLSPAHEDFKLRTLAQDAGVALVIQILGIILLYVVQVTLAQWMGGVQYGIYQYVISWSALLGLPAGLGFPRAVLRLFAEYRVKQDWGRLRGIARSSWWLTVGASLGLAAIAAVLVLVINYSHPFAYAVPLLMGLGLIPLQALLQLQLSTARAMKDVTLAYAPSRILWPVVTLCGGYGLLAQMGQVTGISMVAISTLALTLVLGFQLGLMFQRFNDQVEPAPAIYMNRVWLGISVVLLIQQAFATILNQTDVIMVGSFVGPEAAGIYSASVKTGLWVSFVLQTVNMVAAPAFATLYAQKDMAGLQRVVSQVTLWIFWPSMAIAAILLIWTEPILGIFGPSFVAANWWLKVLVVGQLVNALCGSVGSVVIMTGYQNQSAHIFGYSALLNVGLNFLAIPTLGAVGAAIATSITVVIWNLWLSQLVVREVGIHCSIFYALRHRRDGDDGAALEGATIGPGVTESVAAESIATEASATEAVATEASATEASATEASATEASATEPSATEASATEPSATEPSASKIVPDVPDSPATATETPPADANPSDPDA